MVVRPCFKTVTPRQNVAIFTRLSPKKSGLLVTVTLTVHKKTHRVATVGFGSIKSQPAYAGVKLESVAKAGVEAICLGLGARNGRSLVLHVTSIQVGALAQAVVCAQGVVCALSFCSARSL